jgi:hypothetical protein
VVTGLLPDANTDIAGMVQDVNRNWLAAESTPHYLA